MKTESTPLLDRLDPRWPVAERIYREMLRHAAAARDLQDIADIYRALRACRDDTITIAVAAGTLTQQKSESLVVKAAVKRYADREFDVFGRHTDFTRRALQATGQEQG